MRKEVYGRGSGEKDEDDGIWETFRRQGLRVGRGGEREEGELALARVELWRYKHT